MITPCIIVLVIYFLWPLDVGCQPPTGWPMLSSAFPSLAVMKGSLCPWSPSPDEEASQFQLQVLRGPPSLSKQGIPKLQPFFCWTSLWSTHQWLEKGYLEFLNAFLSPFKLNALSQNGHVLPRLQDAKRNPADVHAQRYPRSKTNSLWVTALHIQGVLVSPRNKKLCFLCPVGLKDKNLFTKAWKYFITSSGGRGVLTTRSTGL